MVGLLKNPLLWLLAGAFLYGIRTMIKHNDRDLMARTMLGEARGEGREGMIAVGHAIKNRADRGGWWGNTIANVVLKDDQFSAWNEGDPNRPYMLGLTEQDPEFVEALALAGGVIDGTLPDPTGGATHYHTKRVNPYWAEPNKITADIGKHIFYGGIA